MQHDLGILYGDGNWTSQLASHHLFDEKIYAVCSHNYPLETVLEPAELLDKHLIHMEPSRWRWAGWKDWFNGFGIDYDVPPSYILFNNLPLVLQAASSGMGIALGWEFAVRAQLAQGIFKEACVKPLATPYADYLVYNRQRSLNPAAEAFRDWLLAEASGAYTIPANLT